MKNADAALEMPIATTTRAIARQDRSQTERNTQVRTQIKKPPHDCNRKGGREKYIKVIISRKDEKMKLTAKDAKMLNRIIEAEELEDGMKEIYGEILAAISRFENYIKMMHITDSEAKELLNNGYKIYSIDGAVQYNHPDGFDENREVLIEW